MKTKILKNLPLLFAAFLLSPNAFAAKLCVKNGPVAPSWTANPENGEFFWGEDCNVNVNGFVNITNACTKLYLLGDSVVSTPCGVGAKSTEMPETVGSGGGHWCKLAGKKTWVCVVANEPMTTYPGYYCGMVGVAGDGRAAMLMNVE